MRRCLIVVVGLLLATATVTAEAPKLGVGLSGGLDWPLLQEDQGNGTVFSFRGRIEIAPILVVEPNLTLVNWGDPDLGIPGVTNDLEGASVTAFGVDGLLRIPMGSPTSGPFALAGVGFYKVKRDQTNLDETRFGLAGGLGFAFGINPAISADLRGKLHVIPMPAGGSKKSLSAMLGVNYTFGM